jgi:hypothetical protein
LDRTGHLQTSANAEDKYVSREIGAANSGVQIKFAAGGISWIPATGVFGAMSGAKMPRCSKRVPRLLRSSAENK